MKSAPARGTVCDPGDKKRAVIEITRSSKPSADTVPERPADSSTSPRRGRRAEGSLCEKRRGAREEAAIGVGILKQTCPLE